MKCGIRLFLSFDKAERNLFNKKNVFSKNFKCYMVLVHFDDVKAVCLLYTTQNLIRIKLLFLFAEGPAYLIPNIL